MSERNFKEASFAIKADRKKSKVKHPYAAIEHRVIDSPAFADLKGSAVKLLLILARQLNQHQNNGHLQATWSYCRKFGIRSEDTLRAAIVSLIKHGLIHRTRSSGSHKQWARYAVTWLPIKDRDGLYLHAWQFDAWKDWVPEKKSTPRKLPDQPPENRCNPSSSPLVIDGLSPLKTDDYVLVPSMKSPGPADSPDLNRERSA